MNESFLTWGGYRWLKLSCAAAAALILGYVAYARTTTPSGGTAVGLAGGVAGLLAILLLLSFGIRKRSHGSTLGSVQEWLSAHVYVGLLVLLLVAMHAGFRFSFSVHTLAFVLLAVVAASGVVGTILYVSLPNRFQHHGAELTPEEVEASVRGLVAQMQSLCRDKSPGFVSACRPYIERRPPPALHASPVEESERSDFLQFLDLAARRIVLEKRFRSQMRIKNVLEAWLYVHVPLSLALMAAVLVHILLVWYY